MRKLAWTMIAAATGLSFTVALFASSGTAQATPILLNGFFDDLPAYTDSFGATVPKDWVSTASYDLYPSYNHPTNSPVLSAPDSLSLSNLDSDPAATITQTLNDVAGQSYTVSYYVYASAGDNGSFFSAYIVGTTPSKQYWNSSFNSVWTRESFTFTGAGGGLDTLALAADNSPSYWYFDNVSVTPTPLPAALPLFAGGLGMIGLLARRRKRKDAASAAAV